MNTPRPAATIAVTLMLAGCSFSDLNPSGDREDVAVDRVFPRLVEIEVDDLQSGLPCRVIDRPDAETQNVLWRAEFEQGFCQRKAEETRLVLQDQGWVCRPQSAAERRHLLQLTAAQPPNVPHVIASWRCVGGLQPIQQRPAQQQGPDRPPLPAAKPDVPEGRSVAWGNAQLQNAVERDLAAIGQDVVGDEATVQAALGDLNDDGDDDAIVILTRDADRNTPHRMLMAYLKNDEAYTLVDVWILKAPDDRKDGKLTLAIEDGTVRIEDSFEDRVGPTILVLDDRKLTYANGS
ncbi:MAG: hypothetical protein OEU92_29295 [Alphaproteobacteria bacterium]|nr:hypothetical protein [Alphaproteobacteria bacterium]